MEVSNSNRGWLIAVESMIGNTEAGMRVDKHTINSPSG